jgi:hypothetical protein
VADRAVALEAGTSRKEYGAHVLFKIVPTMHSFGRNIIISSRIVPLMIDNHPALFKKRISSRGQLMFTTKITILACKIIGGMRLLFE